MPKKSPPKHPTKKIMDEFTDRPISRQRKWQLRKVKAGRCHICGKPSSTSLCLIHMHARRAYARKINGNTKFYANTKLERLLKGSKETS